MQDQYRGVCARWKLLQTIRLNQSPLEWLPEYLFTQPKSEIHLLYYTEMTVCAKGILAEIVRGMFLNSTNNLSLLPGYEVHALDLYDRQFSEGNLRDRQMWEVVEQNKWMQEPIPRGETNIRQIRDYCLGYKLPGAGGVGFLYWRRISRKQQQQLKITLHQNPCLQGARFVGMFLSEKGFKSVAPACT